MHFCSLVNNFKIGEIDVDDVPGKMRYFLIFQKFIMVHFYLMINQVGDAI